MLPTSCLVNKDKDMPNYNTQGITSSAGSDPRNLGGSEGYGNPTASTSSGLMSSTANATTNNDDNDDEPGFFESIANLFSGAGADLPSDKSDDDGDSGISFYDSPMFTPYDGGSDNDTTPQGGLPFETTAADRALYEALGVDVPEVYQGKMPEEEPDPNFDPDVLQSALQPEPITVEEIEVKAGDTLTAIAEEKGVPVQAVIDANPQIKNPDLIRPGEVVSVPDPRFEGVPKPRGVADSPRLSESTEFNSTISNTTDPTQGLLDVIAAGEGAIPSKLQRQAKLGIGTTAYDMVYGYGSVVAPSKPITEMTLAEVEKYQKELINATKGTLPKTDEGTSAVGKYQVVRRSLFGSNGNSTNPEKDSWAEKLGLSKDTVFSPEVQEKIGRLALKETGYDNYMAGNKSQAATMQRIADIWASVEGSTAGQGTRTSKEKVKGFLELVKPGSSSETGLMSRPVEESELSSETESVIKEVNAAPTTDEALDIVTDAVAKKDPLLITNPVQWIYEQPNLIGLTENDAEGQDTIVGFFSSSLGRADQREYVTASGRAKAGEGYSVTSKSGAWCATFVDHVLSNLGMDRLQNTKEGKKTNYARVGATHYQTLGKGVKLSETKAGDLAVFNAHIGFVVGKVDGIATSDKDNATALQEGLTKAGFSTEGIDGLWGPNSAKALSSYQKAKGLPVTGNVTPETFKSLTNKEGKVTTNVLVLGGNQNNSVNVTSYPASKINNFRRVGPVQDLDDKTFKAVTADIQKAGSTN
jgi:LysM repeat protein